LALIFALRSLRLCGSNYEIMDDGLKESVQVLKGVGPRRLRLLKRLGIETVEDILYFFPRRYEDRSCIKTVSQLRVGDVETVCGEVRVLDSRRTRKGGHLFQMAVSDNTGVMYAVWFNQPYMKDRFKAGDTVILHGRVRAHGHIQMVGPEYEILSGGDEDLLHTGRIVPVYSSTEGLNQRWLRSLVRSTLDGHLNGVEEFLPGSLIEGLGLPSLLWALAAVHFPDSFEDMEKARRRLILDEFLILQAGIVARKRKMKLGTPGIAHDTGGELFKKLLRGLPFDLTGAQRRAIEEIKTDMARERPMTRLVHGEVGSGKTVVAALAVAIAMDGGYQSAVMAPTEILASQHYQTLQLLLGAAGARVELLLGDLTPRRRRAALDAIASGARDVVVGTHALIQEDVNFSNLGLAVIDEQHRFGVAQRAVLRRKGPMPDVIVMTATPIPRTLALTVYGDLDVSVIDELPPGRGRLTTHIVPPSKLCQAYAFIREKVMAGNQAYIIYPLVEESDKLELKAAVEMADRLGRRELAGISVGLIHGRMGWDERADVMRRFKKGQIKVLVATTVIEVGIDVPAANVMLIEHAERFGLAQLHQLRGRIGRGSGRAWCMIYGEAKTDEARRRLKAMDETGDGFVIAQKDLEIRGPGEFFGTRQHGLPDLKIGDIVADLAIMETARKEAEAILEADPSLSLPEHARLKEKVIERFKGRFALLSA